MDTSNNSQDPMLVAAPPAGPSPEPTVTPETNTASPAVAVETSTAALATDQALERQINEVAQNPPQPPVAQQAAATAPTEQKTQEPSSQDTSQQNAQNPTPPPAPKKPKKHIDIRYFIVALLVIVALALAGFLWTKVGDKPDATENNSTENEAVTDEKNNDETNETEVAAKSQECFAYAKNAPSTEQLAVPAGFVAYKSELGRFTIMQPEGWTAAETITDDNTLSDVISCSDGQPKGGMVTFTSPKGSKIVITIAGLTGGRGGDCVPGSGDKPFAAGNFCPSQQNLGVVTKASADKRLSHFILNKDTPQLACYSDDGKEGACPENHLMYVYKEKYANTITNDDPKTEAPQYSLCLGTSSGVAATSVENHFGLGSEKMGAYTSCASSIVFGLFSPSGNYGYRIGAYAQDTDPSTEASLLSEDMKLAATALASLRLL